MGKKLKRFSNELKRTLKNLGSATDKVLKSLDTPEQREIDKKFNKVINGY